MGFGFFGVGDPVKRFEALGLYVTRCAEEDVGGLDEIDEVFVLAGEITFHNGDESGFTARRWGSSSTAC